ncbi:MFS transporter [Alicyclobacillus dauci]|uniref:MFS transporter n=1 Tax=Alicyclobacillus dauci TaxID=1475485 RepID=A0ABY6YZR9_9BACL|nr:MFS transporter [Alicyclobacillus dauci]WAH36076.1 MFS transporter [Alicyclobacillus dauci]
MHKRSIETGFWFLTFADGISTLGNQAGWMACLWSAVAQNHGVEWASVLSIGFGVSTAAANWFIGSLLDRMPAKLGIAVANGVLALIWTVLAVLLLVHSPVWLWLVLLILAGLLAPFTELGWMVLMPSLVRDESLERANSVSEIVFQGAALGGPVIGSLLIRSVGSPGALFLDALTFCMAGVVMACLPEPEVQNAGVDRGAEQVSHSRSNWFQDALVGAKWLVRQPVVLGITGLAFLLNFGFGLLDVSFPMLVQRELQGPATWLGDLLGLNALGMVIGAAIYGWWGHLYRSRKLPMLLVVGWALCLTPFLVSQSIVVLCAGTGLAGLVFGAFPPLARSTVQRLVPKEYHGSVFGLRATAISLFVPLGGFAAGSLTLSLHLTPAHLIGWMAVASVVIVVAVVLSLSRWNRVGYN